MLGLRNLLRPTAGPSRIVLNARVAPTTAPLPMQARFRSDIAPRKVKYRKAQKGRPGMPTGGSIKGTTLTFDGYGLRLLTGVRITAAQLTSALAAVKRKIKPIKGAQCHLRVFPDVPVCVKGNETRMGKGKGAFEYWACRVPAGRVIMELSGGGIREEIARQALKLAQVKFSVGTEFISKTTPPRLGNIVSEELARPKEARAHIMVTPRASPLEQSVACKTDEQAKEASV